MKPLFFFLAIAIVSSCGTASSADEVEQFIPGTYTRAAEHEFGAEHDTISITLQSETANEYKINRRWKYARILDDKPIEPEYKNSNTTGTYNAETKMLKESEAGETYTFDVKLNLLFAGTTKYVKLK